MTVTISKIQKQGKLKPGEIVSQYLNLLPSIFSKKERENFIFVNGVGCIGLVFEGKVNRKAESNFTSHTVKIADKNFAIMRYSLINDEEAIKSLASKLVNDISGSSSFVLMEHTAKWDIYKGKNWLNDYSPPRLTPKNNIFLPQGSISMYFGFGKDQWGVYKNERRGINFAKTIKTKHYPTITSRYYGKFLDTDNLMGLATKKETGLRHFTMGIYERKGKPIVFHIKSQTNVGKQTILSTDASQIVCSHLPVAKVLKEKFYKDGKLKLFPSGEILEHTLNK